MKAFYADRREFLKSTVWMGALAAAAGCVGSSLKLVETCGAPMQGFALKPMKRVRVAVIGVGTRGRAALRRIANLPGTEITPSLLVSSFLPWDNCKFLHFYNGVIVAFSQGCFVRIK